MLINFEISAANLRRDKTVVEAFLIVPTLLRGNAASDALRHASLERCKMHYHAERGNDVLFTLSRLKLVAEISKP